MDVMENNLKYNFPIKTIKFNYREKSYIPESIYINLENNEENIKSIVINNEYTRLRITILKKDDTMSTIFKSISLSPFSSIPELIYNNLPVVYGSTSKNSIVEKDYYIFNYTYKDKDIKIQCNLDDYIIAVNDRTLIVKEKNKIPKEKYYIMDNGLMVLFFDADNPQDKLDKYRLMNFSKMIFVPFDKETFRKYLSININTEIYNEFLQTGYIEIFGQFNTYIYLQDYRLNNNENFEKNERKRLLENISESKKYYNNLVFDYYNPFEKFDPTELISWTKLNFSTVLINY